jgi:hypothetical protein
MEKDQAIECVSQELAKAMTMHEPIHSAHEDYAVIKEELDELWEAVKRVVNIHDTRQNGPLRKEATQTATMAIRFLIDLKL